MHARTISQLSICLGLIVCLCGCAAPRRTGESFHSVERFTGRPDGMVSREEWRDVDKGGGIFLLSTSNAQSLHAKHDNQPALGGGSDFTAGPISITGDPATVKALGDAIGQVAAEVIKGTIGKP